MKIRELAQNWEQTATGRMSPTGYVLHLDVEAAARLAALAEMYVQGVSTRKVKAITEELCGHNFSASSISAINKGLDEALVLLRAAIYPVCANCITQTAQSLRTAAKRQS